MSPVFRDLVGFVEGVRSGLVRGTAAALGLWAVAGALAALLLAWVAVDSGGGGGTVVPLVLDLLLVVLLIGAAFFFRRSREEWISEGRVARSIERECGLASGTLRSSVELARELPAGVSAGLAEAGARETMVRLREAGADPRGELGRAVRRWSRRGWAALALLSPLVVAAALGAPERAGAALGGLLGPLEAWSGPVLPPIEVSPGDAEILRGTELELTIRAPARDSVTVGWRAAGELPRSAKVGMAGGVAGYRLPELRARTEYWVEASDGARTPRHVLTPVDPLLVTDLTVSIDFPPHTGRFPEEYRGVVPPLELPEGSSVTVEGRASRPLADASLRDEESGRAIPLKLEGGRFEAVWIPDSSGRLAWEFVDERGRVPEVAPDPLEVTVTEDAAPGIEILMPGRDTVLAASRRQPLVIEATDDYGVDRVELVVWRVSALGERGEPSVQAIDLGRSRSALLRPVMELTAWRLLTGDTVRYFARAVDNAPQAHTTQTPEYVLRPPGRSDLRREAETRLQDARTELQELTDETTAQAEEMRDREREAAARQAESRPARSTDEESRAEFQEREEVRQALEDREETVERADSLATELEAMQEELRELADPELQESLSELQQMMEELTPEEARRRLEEMNERLESMEPQGMDDAFREMAEDQEATRDRMEEALDRMRRAALEQEFRAAGQEAEELSRQEEALSRAMEEGDRPELRAEQQRALEERAGELQERMERLGESLTEEGDELRREAVERGEQRGREAQQSMESARRNAEEGRMDEAAEDARQAARRMQEMSDELEQAGEQQDQQMMEALRQAYRQTSNDALALAREQEALRESMRGAGQDELARMRADEAALLQGTERMAENLAAMNRLTGNDDREISERMGEAMEAIEETARALEDQRGRTPSPYGAAEEAMRRLNDVAMTAMENAQNLGEGGQGESSAEQMMQQMQQLAQQQSQVNEQTGEMTPMELGEQAMREQMQEAGESQEQVADQLGEMSQEAGEDSRNLGDVDAMAEEAQALAEMLQGGRLDGTLRDRQQRLFHRLLDAGRSLERDEETEERESEVPGAYERDALLPLSAEQLELARFRPPTAEQLRALSPAERLMVLQYFERLNRERERGGGGGR